MPSATPENRGPAPSLSQHDPPPEPGPGGPPVFLVTLVVFVIFTIVVLHLTGVVGG